MPPRRFGLGRTEDGVHPDAIRAAISEFLATTIFVFASEGSLLALGKIFKEFMTAGGVMTVALASGLALATAVAVAHNFSGGHVNPAVTLGVLLGGRISFLRALYYLVAQLLGAIVASLLLRLTTAGMRPAGFAVSSGIGVGNGVVLEIVLTFGLVFAYYATVIDPKRGSLGTIAPLIIGFIFAANILAGGPFDGASMNPARTFGVSLVGWRWRDHWVYWVGPLVGGALAGLIYEYLLIPSEEGDAAHQPLAPEDY